MPAQINSPKELIMHKMHLLVNAEMQIKDALALVADMVHSEDLKKGVEIHLDQTYKQLDRLGGVMEAMGFAMMDMTDEAVKAMIEQGQKMANAVSDPQLRDITIIGAMKHIEMYERLCYKAIVEKAQILGMQEGIAELEESMKEEEIMFNELEERGKKMMGQIKL